MLGSAGVKIKCHRTVTFHPRGQELCESRGGRPGLPASNKPTASVDVKQHFNNNVSPKSSGAASVKVEVTVLGSPASA